MSMQDELNTFARGILDSDNSCLPARVVKVNDDGSVNVVAIRNDEIPDCVITVPVLRPETKRAYIMLKIKEGDRGVVKFCDKSIESYRLTGSEEYNGDDRQHSISDGVFQLGFLPDNEKFVFPDGEVVIGLKNNKCQIIIDESGNLTFNAEKVTFNSDVNINGKVTATDDVIAGSISTKSHVHSGVTSGGSNTGLPR